MDAFRERHQHVSWIEAGRLASRQVVVDAEQAFVDGERICAVLFRACPDASFAADFVDADGVFCSNEARALWLAVLQLPTTFAVSRPDAEIWYSSSEWSVWRRRLMAARIAVVDLAVGDVDCGIERSWIPWGGGVLAAPRHSVRRMFAPALTTADRFEWSISCAGEILAGPSKPAVSRAVELLHGHGIMLAGVLTDGQDRMVCCTSHPQIADSVVSSVARRVVDLMLRGHENLHRR